jgi:hypothetical protein
MTVVFRALLGWFSGGSALATLASVVLTVCALVFGLLYRRYLGILGADRRKPAERQAYDALRESLAEGNLAARLYADRLTRFLDWIDHFFGDADMADRTLFARAFRLRTPAPLWTAPALDRCLLLALIYPIVIILIIWAVSGHVGPAEGALHLRPNMPAWQRVPVAAGFGVAFLLPWLSSSREFSLHKTLALGSCIMAVTAAAQFASDVGGWGLATVGLSLPPCLMLLRTGGVSSAGGTIVFVIGMLSGTVYLSFYILTLPFTATVFLIAYRANKSGRLGTFLSIFLPVMFLVCLAEVSFLPASKNFEPFGPLLLFFGLLTLLNAPFDWASLGLTRALLRFGLELGGWWPYALALVDAALAAVIIAALALTMVVGVQAFDALAVHGGGAPVLPLGALFDGVAANPNAPEYWWLYALLLSTMIPSLVNLVIGGTSLVRGLPGVPSLLLRFIPERGGVLKWDRHWIATLLTAQVAAGAALGIAAQVFLVWVIIGYVMPFFGLELLGMARDVAAFNLPARVAHLFGVSL